MSASNRSSGHGQPAHKNTKKPKKRKLLGKSLLSVGFVVAIGMVVIGVSQKLRPSEPLDVAGPVLPVNPVPAAQKVAQRVDTPITAEKLKAVEEGRLKGLREAKAQYEQISIDELPTTWPQAIKLHSSQFNHPDTEHWRKQVEAHAAQPMTFGWTKFLDYTISKQRDPLEAPTFKQMAEADIASGLMIVKLQPGLPAGGLIDLGLTYKRALGGALVPDLHLFSYDTSTDVQTLLEDLNARVDVVYAEPDYQIQQTLVPNDPNISGDGWWLDMINAYEAWETTTDATAIGPVGVFDDGIDFTHQDLIDNLWVNSGETAGNGVDDDGNGFIDDTHGILVSGGGSRGHGTPVSGTICGQGDNGIGYAGSAWDCQLMNLSSPLSFSGVASDYSVAMPYAVSQNSRLSNHSWRVFIFSQQIADVTDALEVAGHLVIAAAGNEANNIDTAGVSYPARLPNDNVLSIAAAQQSGESRIFYSSYGPTSVDLAAPTEFPSTYPGNTYSRFSGTSQATPVVTGAVALAWSMDPSMTFLEIKQLVMDTARPVASWDGLTVTGAILDMQNLVESVIVDTDGDGILDDVDTDDDNDGISDEEDAFPRDPDETVDTDGDGIGNNTDTDDDGDGVSDADDWRPLDPTEQYDTDGDGIGNSTDTDDDGDGVLDINDAFPVDATETTDSDGDGVGDNADTFPTDATETADSDGDGVGDNSDIDRDNDGLADELELRTSTIVTDWPVLTGNTSFADGVLNANGGGWGSQANSARFSIYGYSDNYRFSFRVDALGSNNMIGLGRVEGSASYIDIDYAFYIVGTTLYLYENGGLVLNIIGTVAAGDILSIEVAAGTITYRHNDTVLRTVTYSDTPDFYVDSSFYSGAIRVSNLELNLLSGSGFSADADNDGVTNDFDLDSDNDTIPDVIEAGLADSDGDLMVDSTDLQASVDPAPDSDGDGIPDYLDLESLNAANDGTAYDISAGDLSVLDTNEDGMLDGNDTQGGNDVNGNGVDDRAEDADGDGISNPADNDDDNDGILDTDDAFPFDPTETMDTDGDGVGDNSDVFPNDPSRTTGDVGW